jgi:histo-blood group ABO system transferase
MKVNLLIIATNKYIKFLPKLIESIEQFWINDMVTDIHIFTDRIKDCDMLLSQTDYDKGVIEYHEVEHNVWPASTLYRYHFFKKYMRTITGHYVFYIDADTIIASPIGKDILSPRTVVQHCGYVNGGGTFETRHDSTSFVPMSQRKVYYGGGFWGCDLVNFKKLVSKAVEMIDDDLARGIMPIWHDESVLNCYMANCEPTKVLSPSYHYPEANPRIWKSWPEQYPCKILLLNKNHKEIRE